MTRPAQVLIRPAAAADCAAIAAVQIQSYRTAYAPFFPASYFARFSQTEQEQEWRELLASQQPVDLLVAVAPGDQVAGYSLARIEDTGFAGYTAEIVALHVLPAWKGQGAGRALLGTAVSRLVARGCTGVMLWTLQGNPVRAWYERLGALLLGEKQYETEGWQITEVAYGWPDPAALAARLGGEEANNHA